MIRRSFLASSLALWLAAAPLPGRTLQVTCGTERGARWTAPAEHEARRLMERRLRPAAREAQQPWARDYGHIAVMDARGGVVMEPNSFNLTGRSVSFEPVNAAAASYRLQVAPQAYDPQAAERGQRLEGLGDDDFRSVGLPFEFPFFGQRHRTMLVHSDGTVTFVQPDADSSARSLGRLFSGPPRIAPLFADLDPTRGGAVTVDQHAGRVTVTWRDVPEYRDFGTGPRQTFQLVLEAGGRISFHFVSGTPSAAVVGIAPGYLQGSPEVVDYDAPPGGEFTSAVAERFGNERTLDVVRIAQRFFETHEDAYDYLVIFNSLDIAAAPNAVAYEVTVRSNTTGIGDTALDRGFVYGSPRRLQAVLNMGPLSQYPRDPYARVGSRGAITGDSTMTILGHEAGHLFLALASVRDPDRPTDLPMLGAQLAHWSFNFHSDASLLEGNRIADNGDGTFLTTATVEGFSALDQYLMGLRGPGEVEPVFYVANSGISRSALPQVNFAIRGQRRNVTIEDLIAAEGRRTPDDTVAQRLFRFAFILIVPAGTEPSAEELAQLETYRAEFEPFFHRAAGGRAWAGASLHRMLSSTIWPAAGGVAGEPIPVRLSIARPLNRDLRIGLYASSFIEPVQPAVIPAGATETTLTLRATGAGVADVYFFADDPSFEVVHQKLDVKAARAQVSLVDYWRDEGLLVLRATDENRLPYPGLPVRIEGLDRPVRTDAGGFVWLAWDGSAPATAWIEGAESTRIVVRP
ncbi:MAG: hypothetical protein KatS3mg005_0867 [Bryobacteraceae bacterium]|nr:MAG: hypothetical protein KatS3mg005_0867 [Bryobacteraceae bacterium]